MTSSCPLCLSQKIKQKLSAKKPFLAQYFQCDQCDLTFIGREYLLDEKSERSRYDYHENNIEDEGYTNFLSRLINPTKKYIEKDDYGLDFGSGPEPVLSQLMQREGYSLDIYDPLYASEKPKRIYDFITSTEVIEHFNHPAESFNFMLSLLKADGVLALMTNVLNDSINFETWSYRYDDTHVAFYSDKTFEWIAESFKLQLIHSERNVRIFRKVIS